MDELTWPPTEMLMLLLAASAPADAVCVAGAGDEPSPADHNWRGLSNVNFNGEKN